MPEEASSVSETTEAPTLDADVVEQSADASPETSSPSETGDGPESILDAVNEALDEKGSVAVEDQKDEGTPSSSEDQTTDEADSSDQSEEAVTEGDPPFHEHPRWQEQIAKYRDLEEKHTELESRLKTYEEGHQMAAGLETYLNENRLSYDDANAALDIASLMRNDPAKALEVLRPYVEELEVLTGAKLPGELQQHVDAGKIDVETARSIASQTGKLTLQERNLKQQQDDVREQQRQVVHNAVADWERKTQEKDPDYTHKSTFLRESVALKVRQMAESGTPIGTPEQAVQVIEQAYAEINEKISAFRPNKTRELKPVADTAPAAPAKKEPSSVMDVVNEVCDRFEEAS